MTHRAAEFGFNRNNLNFDAWGVPKTSVPKSLFHGLFTYDVPSRSWLVWQDDVEVINSASTQVESVDCALTVTADAIVQNVVVGSKRHPRYQPNRGHLWSASLILPNLTANGIRDFGLFTDENGVFFRLDSAGKLYAVIRSNSIETVEHIVVPGGIDLTCGNIYDIQFQWRGVGNYKFFIGEPSSGKSVLVHTFDFLGRLTELSMQNPALPCRFECTALGTDDVTLKCGCVDVSSENGLPSEKAAYTSTISNAVLAVTNTPVIAIRQPATINGKHNTRDARLLRITVSSDKKATLVFYVSRDPASVIGGAWITVNGGSGSYVEQNLTATSVNLALTNAVTSIPVEAGSTREVTNPNPEIVDFLFIHGDILILVGTGANATIQAVVEWGEEV